MVYKAIGVTSGGWLNELQVAYVHLQEKGGSWAFEILHGGTYAYPEEWTEKLKHAAGMAARDYQQLHTAFGHFIGQQVNRFIDDFSLHHRVDLVAAHGHTAFHLPEKKVTAQLGDGAAIAAVTALPVVTDMRAVDIAFGGQGAPIEAIGDKLLFGEYDLVLSLRDGGRLSVRTKQGFFSYDINLDDNMRNQLSQSAGQYGDEQQTGWMPRTGEAWQTLAPTITHQVRATVAAALDAAGENTTGNTFRLLVTGTSTKNDLLMRHIAAALQTVNVEVVVPDGLLVDSKEALVIALLGVLRWREEYTVISSITGATRNSIGGALWLGGEA